MASDDAGIRLPDRSLLECGYAEVAERQTRYVQGVVPLWVCGFKSHLRHQRARSGKIVSVRALVAQLDRAQPCGG